MSGPSSILRRPASVAVATAVIAGLALAGGTAPASAAVGTPGSLAVGLPNSATPVLSWSRPRRVGEFVVQIDNDSSFSSPEVATTTRNTRFVPQRNLSRGTQYWRVRSSRDGQFSPWASGSFAVTAVTVPVGTAPADGSVLPQPDVPPLLRWQASRGAVSYTVEVDGDSDFIGAKSYTTKTTSLALPDALPAGDYFWRVVATLDGGFNSTPSPTMSFVLGSLPSPQLTYPLDDINQSVEDVVFDWEPVPGAVTYDLQVATDSTFNNFAYRGENIYGSRYSPPVTTFNDQFWWRVRAVDLAGQPTAWSTARFSFQRSWLDTPDAIYPTGATSVADEQVVASNGDQRFFQWSPVQHASRYQLVVARDRQFSVESQSCITAATTYAPRNGECTFPTGQVFYWKVRPLDDPYPDGLPGIFSTTQKVVWGAPTPVGPPPASSDTPVTGQRVSLTGRGAASGAACVAQVCGAMSATPVLAWDKMSGATSYLVYVANDVNFTTTNLSRDPIVTTNTFVSLRGDVDSKAALPESEAGKPYFWFVRPCWSTPVEGSACGPSPVSSDTSSLPWRSFVKASPPVTGLTSSSPAGTDITFSWQDYLTTNLGPSGQSYGQTGQQAARSYRIQVDTEPSFAEPLLDSALVDQTTYTAGDRLYPEGRIYWRVQAVDAQENGLTWSSTAELVKASPALTLRSPAPGAAVAGSAPLEWSPQAFARSYDVEIYKNNDGAFSPVNRVVEARVLNPAYTPSEPLPASALPYVWRVRRTDAKGNVGPWSSGSFVSTGSSPELLAPAPGVWQPSTGALLTWSDVAGATSYELVLRSGSGSSSTATVATAYAPSELGSGDYTWTVTALDAAGRAMGTSAPRSFRVDAVAPSISSVKPGSSAKRTSVFVATFSEKVTGVNKSTMRLFQKGKKKPLKAKVVVKGKQVKLKPAKKLKKGKTYRVELTFAKIKDAAGNPLTEPGAWSVTVS